jgi:spore germination protein PE
MIRTSIVNHVIITSVTSASTLIFGDAVKITARNRALAVQRQVAKFFENEGEFEDFDLFTQPIPQPDRDGLVNMRVINESPFIEVNSVDVIGVAQASTLQIGSTMIFDLESRIKHFRQFVSNERKTLTPLSAADIAYMQRSNR